MPAPDAVERALDKVRWTHTHLVMTPASRAEWLKIEADAREQHAGMLKALKITQGRARHAEWYACVNCSFSQSKSVCTGCSIPHDPDDTPNSRADARKLAQAGA